MLQILNETPFKTAISLTTDQSGADRVNVAVKGTFILTHKDNHTRLATEQLPVLLVDEYFGKPGESSIKYPVDLVLEKLNTNVGLIGNARSPGGRPVKQLITSVTIGSLNKSILVTGDRYWIEKSLSAGFDMTDAIPFTHMPLVFERAFGGADLTEKNSSKHDFDRRNPIGTGFRTNRNAVANHKLPNLEDPTHLISHWKDRPPIACFGFADSAWDPRLRYAGTYDDGWLKSQCPLLPEDFDLRFFNAADPDLVSETFLKGGEPVRLVNVSEKGVLEFSLPTLDIRLMFRLGQYRDYRKADVWTVAFEPDQDRFYMVWGKSISVGKQPSRMRYVKVEMVGDEDTIFPLRPEKESMEPKVVEIAGR